MKVRAFGSLKIYTEGKDLIEIDIDSERRVQDIIGSLNIPENYVYIIEKNGETVEKDMIVNNSDQITLIPLLSGG
jgi:sulfur carrier protein ThiS